MRATLSHFLSKMGLKRPGGPSSQKYPYPPSSDSSLPESLRVLTEMHLQLLGKPELPGISLRGLGARSARFWSDAPAGPAKTPLFTAREPLWRSKTPLFTAPEPLWRSKWLLGPARLLPVRSKELFGPASVPPVRSKWPLRPAPVLPVRSKRLLGPALAVPVPSEWSLSPALLPPVRSKRLFEPASVPPVRSKRLFQDHYSKMLVSVTLCSEPLYSALLCSCMDMHGFTLYIATRLSV